MVEPALKGSEFEPGWARFIWFPGDVTFETADGTPIPGPEPRPAEEHLRDEGFTEQEIRHALGDCGQWCDLCAYFTLHRDEIEAAARLYVDEK